MAKYMIEHGAGTIVLLSRSGGGNGMVQQLQDEIQCHDAQILVKKCDASDKDQVQQLVADCAKSLPPICGVIHAAMVLRVSLQALLLLEDTKAWSMLTLITGCPSRGHVP
jgi:NAD(P)-dependent dehydrogenase (short-subunit alcohol dehydrogenase family)